MSGLPLGRDDLVVVCGGFEPRSVKMLEEAVDGASGFRVAIIDYLPPYSQNRGEELLDLARGSGCEVFSLLYDRRNPAGIGALLLEACPDVSRYWVDVSGMSRLLIVQVLVAVIGAERNVTILYVEADDYAPTEQEFDAATTQGGRTPAYISSGIWEIASTPELASIALPGEAVRLIAFPTFDASHLGNLIQELQPTYTELLEGVPPRQEHRWRMSAIKSLNAAMLEGLDVQEHAVSTLDYRETLREVLEVYRMHSVFDRLVVAPTGSKMQAVAIGLLRSKLEDLQVVYPVPREFVAPDEYSRRSRELYRLDLPPDFLALS